MKILVTGCAGFIGYHTALRFLSSKLDVWGIDNLNSYYDQNIKRDRLENLNKFSNFHFYEISLESKDLSNLMNEEKFDIVINLAGQAGVRYSKENPDVFYTSNILGFHNLIECCRKTAVAHLVYASSSSVYGNCKSEKFQENLDVTNPISYYAATKVSNEVVAKSYKNMFGLRSTGLRFFTVYGPWGRPDMAVYDFTKKIHEEKKIILFNQGMNKRDFTYIDDVVDAIQMIALSKESFPIYNIGNSKPCNTIEMVEFLENLIGKKAITECGSPVIGDVLYTCADTSLLLNDFNIQPKITLYEGLSRFIEWYNSYYGVKSA